MTESRCGSIRLYHARSSTLCHEEDSTMKSPMIAAVFGMFVLALGMGTLSLAQEAKSPTQFTLGILADHNVSFVLPSALIVDERGRASGVTLAITNHTKQKQG